MIMKDYAEESSNRIQLDVQDEEETKKKAILPWNMLQILKTAKRYVFRILKSIQRILFSF